MSILGNRVLRKEDPRFLRGEATYVENLPLEGARTVTFVRSPFAHARITGIDASAAEALPNVEVLTGADFDGVAIAPPPIPVLEQRLVRPIVAKDVVRFVGDIVAVVLSDDRASGMDAAELVSVEYDPLPVLLDPKEAAKDELLLFPDVGTNIAGRAGRMEHDPTLFEAATSSSRTRSSASAWPPARSKCARLRPSGRTARSPPGSRHRSPHRDHHGALPDARARSARAAHHRAGRRRRLRGEEPSAPRRRSSSGWRRTSTPGSLDGDAHREHDRAPPRRAQRLEFTIGGTRDGKVLAYRLEHPRRLRRVSELGAFLPNLTGDDGERRLRDPGDRGRRTSAVTNTTPMTTFRGAGRPRRRRRSSA